jgi:hypothetical protein
MQEKPLLSFLSLSSPSRAALMVPPFCGTFMSGAKRIQAPSQPPFYDDFF